MDFQKLDLLICQKKLKIGVIGFGYVGMPLGIEFAKKGFKVTAFETDKEKIKKINNGKSYITDVKDSEIYNAVKKNLLKATDDFSYLKEQDLIIICVPTPLSKTKEPDISYIISVCEKISKNLNRGAIIILESTTYPTTTSKIVKPILEKSGLKAGKDFYLAFSPERIDPGNKKFNIKNTPKIVGGIDETSGKIAQKIYSLIIKKVFRVSNSDVAEMVKLLENTFRAVNIAMINEFALICDKLGIDIWEVIDAAKTKPFGFMPFYPGPGIGGHCIPLDPMYLRWKMKKMNFKTKFIELADEINSKMPEYAIKKLKKRLKLKSLKGLKILVVGITYKPDINDTRQSPSIDIITILYKEHAKVFYYDPYVKEIEICGGKMKSIDFKNLSSYDCVIIATAHSKINYKKILKESRKIFDTKNALKGLKSEKIITL